MKEMSRGFLFTVLVAACCSTVDVSEAGAEASAAAAFVILQKAGPVVRIQVHEAAPADPGIACRPVLGDAESTRRRTTARTETAAARF